MAFEEDYFKNRKKDILANYMNTYQGVEYASPPFVSAGSYHTENYEETEDYISSEILFVMRADRAENKGKYYRLTLLQQANHFVQNKELVPLV